VVSIAVDYAEGEAAMLMIADAKQVAEGLNQELVLAVEWV